MKHGHTILRGVHGLVEKTNMEIDNNGTLGGAIIKVNVRYDGTEKKINAGFTWKGGHPSLRSVLKNEQE